MKDGPAVEFRGVSFFYGQREVLRDIDLTVKERDFVTIVGPNGGGKTTLLKLMVGLIQPSAGTVRILGKTPEAARPLIGYLPQHAATDRSFPARVIDVALMGRLRRGLAGGGYSPSDRDAAIEALHQVGLSDSHQRPFAGLSGGEQQRVLIARALTSDPRLLLLDEPTSNLDVAMEKSLYDLLHRLHERMTVMLVTHDMGFVSEFTDSVVCIKQTLACHATGSLTTEMIEAMYGRDVRAVIHDHGDHPAGGS